MIYCITDDKRAWLENTMTMILEENLIISQKIKMTKKRRVCLKLSWNWN